MSGLEEDSKFKYYISLWFENKESNKVINEAIGEPGAFNNNELKKSQKYTTHNYEIFLENDFLEICFPKIDIKFIKSIVNPICKALNIDEIDYPDRIFQINSDKYKSINLLKDYDEYPDYDDESEWIITDYEDDEWKTEPYTEDEKQEDDDINPSNTDDNTVGDDEDDDDEEWDTDANQDDNNYFYDSDDNHSKNDDEDNILSKLVSLDPEDDCIEEEKINNNYRNIEYRYCINLDIIDGMAYRRIADAIGVFDAFPRIQDDDFTDFGENNYGRYKCDKFIIKLDYSNALIKFRELDINYIKSIMNKITDALLYPRDDYELIDKKNHYQQIQLN